MACIGPAVRATPLSPADRRAALIRCTLGLVLEHGPDVSTRQIALAAGVAEGTIFRVFRTKDELVAAAVRQAFDATPLLDRLVGIDEPDLARCLQSVVETLQWGLTRIFHLIGALGAAPQAATPAEQAARQAPVFEAVAALLEPFATELRYPPLDAARRLWLVTFAASHPRTTGGMPLDPADIVDLAFHGIGRHEGATSC